MNDTEKEKSKMSAAARKRLRYGGLATAITVIVVAIVVLINIVVGQLVKKYPVKIDLTENGMYEISDETIDYIKSIDRDVTFTVFMAESSFQTNGNYLKMVSEVLERYTQYSPRITLDYVDPNSNPDVVSKFQTYYTGTLGEGSIVVSASADPSKLRVIGFYDMFEYDQTMLQYYQMGYCTLIDCITGFTGEHSLTAAVMYVNDANPKTVGVLVSANGAAIYSPVYRGTLGVLENTLTNNGYDVSEIDMVTDALSVDDYDLLVLPAPYNDVTADVINKLGEFLYNGGKYGRDLIYIADYTQGATPNLDEFIESYGIQVGSDVILESSNDKKQMVLLSTSGGQMIGAPAVTSVDESYAAQVANASLPLVAPYAREVSLLWDSKTAGITTALLQTSDTAGLPEITNEATGEYKIVDKGVRNVMAVTMRRDSVNDEIVESHIMVLGSMSMIDAVLMQDASYNNAPYFISAVNNMTGKNTSMMIASKALTSQTISMKQSQRNGVLVAIIALPFVIAVIGVVIFIRRRNR